MNRSAAIGLAALLCAASAPAFADWGPVGSITFTARDNHSSTPLDFHADRLALTSHMGDVECRDVEATFGNGRTRTIFRGRLHADDTVNVNLPGDVRDVQQLDFDCRPTDGWMARVDVAANMERGRWGNGWGWDRRHDFDDDYRR